jgi:hypothetical protein
MALTFRTKGATPFTKANMGIVYSPIGIRTIGRPRKKLSEPEQVYT